MIVWLALLVVLLVGCDSSRLEPDERTSLTIVWGNFSDNGYALAVLERNRPNPMVDHNHLESCGSGTLEYQLTAPFHVLLGPDDRMGTIPLLFTSDDMPERGDAGYLISITAAGEPEVLPLDEPVVPWREGKPC